MTMKNIIKLCRPKQWIKNIFILAPMVFAFEFNNAHSWQNIVIAIIAFTCVSSAVYAFNDIRDVELDKKHKKKKNRPVASGGISILQAYIISGTLLMTGLAISLLLLQKECVYILLSYAILQFGYCTYFKHIAIIDVLIIAIGFVLRALMGGAAINVEVTSWMMLSIFLLTLYIGFGKRYHEITVYSEDNLRKSLNQYSVLLLHHLIAVSCCASLMCYSLYIQNMVETSGKRALYFTIIFVTFGLFRYLQHIFVDAGGGEPEDVMSSDRVFLVNGLLWLISTVWILS
jgi:4-hydroxybenzoate polyprenyltransferase